jgi:hypothetical protein
LLAGAGSARQQTIFISVCIYLCCANIHSRIENRKEFPNILRSYPY